MSRAKTQHTRPELAIRSELHRRGFRYRLHASLPFDRRRKADLVFPTERVAVFIDGCFWHSCPLHGTMPMANRDFWAAKLARNSERDRQTDSQLRAAGWAVVRIWEHEDPNAGADRVQDVISRRRQETNGR